MGLIGSHYCHTSRPVIVDLKSFVLTFIGSYRVFFELVDTLWVSRVLKYPKMCLEDLTTFFMSTWWGDSKNMEEIEFPRFWGQTKAGQKCAARWAELDVLFCK